MFWLRMKFDKSLNGLKDRKCSELEPTFKNKGWLVEELLPFRNPLRIVLLARQDLNTSSGSCPKRMFPKNSFAHAKNL